ncbi:TonB-dependent receptor [Sphingomonas bacterium]|uniref:TonB-dependent receptor n=1 Tax=Sphingomonas bacterium TaxID=1895847 RepID=UPI001575421C|nr:TonB-dependent receptor plug domain-containing protein [Sphingomonas bacterium]
MITKVALYLSTALLAATPAFAQTAQPASPVTPPNAPGATDQTGAPDAASSSAVEDIVVTATRRSADLQSVPITIQAVSSSTLKAFNVTGVLSLPSLVSGLVVTPSGGNNIYLRGIGSPSTGFNEAQTAVYIDGLYLANPTIGIYSFNNIDRVEVLKGPQGTLYGRNATGGLISVITRDPGDTERVDASVGYGNYNTLTTNLYASTPLGKTLAAGIAVYHQKQSDGWSRNLVTGHDLQKSDETGVQAKLVWRPGSNTKVTTSFIYDYNNRDYGYAYEVLPGTIANDGTTYQGRYRSTLRIDPSAPTHIYLGTLKVEQDLGFATLQSLSGFQASHANVAFAGGGPGQGQPLAGETTAYSNFYEKNRSLSEELQLVSKASPGERFDWVLGAFYYDDHTQLRLDSLPTCNGSVCLGTPQRNNGFPNTLSGSVFGDGSYRFFKGTHVTVGLRYTAERKTLTGQLSPLPGYPNSVATLGAAATATTPGIVYYPGQPFALFTAGKLAASFPNGIPTRLVFHKLTYRFVLAQDVGDNVHLFVSHNLGFKSGAYNGNGFNNPPVEPELLYATEAGVKSELFDRRVRLNASYFHYNYQNVQVRSMSPPAAPGNALLLNAAKERIDGVDVDLSIVPVRGLTLNGALEYLDAKFVDFPGTTCPTPGTPRVDSRGVTVGTVVNTVCNLAGATPQFAAKWSGTVGAVYNVETDLGSFTVSGNDHYTSSYPTSAQYVVNDAHHIIDASLGWTAPSKRYDVQLWGKNLTKQYIYAVGQVATSFAFAPGAPRTYGATLGVHF